MISHHHKCIFVHVPKVAGVSIEDVFLKDLNLNFRNRMPLLLGLNTNLDIGPPRISHLTAQEYVELKFIPQALYNQYFKFAFVRNPYKRVYSFYKYLGYNNLVSFRKFVVYYLPKIILDPDIYYFIKPMYKYLYSEDGKLLVDYVGKLENINKDFEKIIQTLNIDNVKLEHKNNTQEMTYKSKIIRSSRIVRKYPQSLKSFFLHKNTEQIFDQEMKNVIFHLYKEDFDNFEYIK